MFKYGQVNLKKRIERYAPYIAAIQAAANEFESQKED